MNAPHTGFERDFEHRQQLLDEALEEFISRGYDNASINVILQKAGMSKGQFYYHFKNKEGLYLACIGVLISRKQAFMTNVMSTASTPDSIFDIFRLQVKLGMEFAREYPVINRFANSFLKEKGKPIYDIALDAYNFNDNTMVDALVNRAYEQGEFRTDLPLSFIRHMFGYLLTHSAEVTEMDTADNAEEQLNYLITFIQSGLKRDD